MVRRLVLQNLSKHLWAAYERPVNWQTVSLEAEAGEFETPILFISGSKAVKFSEEEMLKLREYLLRGGTILAESSDHSEAFTQSMEQLVRLMFSERDYPEYQLKLLPADHGIYTVIKQSWKRRPRLRGVSDGSRTFFLVSDEYLSREWQMNEADSDAFRLAMNLLFYTTDLGTLEGKFAAMLPDTAPAKEREAVLRVARVKLPARRLLRSRDEPTHGQRLLVAWDEKRPAVFFSEFDLASAMAGIENFRSLGYQPKSARKIVGNIAAYLMVD